MALLSSVTTKVDSGVMSRKIIQVLTGDATDVGVGDMIDTESLPYASAHLVLTSGTAPSGGTQLTVGNDGLVTVGTPPLVMTNAVNLGPALTTLPNMAALTIGSIIAAGPSSFAAGTVVSVINRFVQFKVVSAAAAFVLTITIEAMGSRG